MMNTLTEEQKTFNRLKRVRFEEIQGHLDDIKRHPTMYSLGNTAFESRKPEIVKHYEQIKCLEKLGWSFEEYILEIEKRNIMRAIDQYNSDNTFPMELVERAKEFFPNARFTQAKIELE